MTGDDPLSKLRAQLDETFHEELNERLQEMEAAVLELERAAEAEARAAALRRLSRDAHSVKGGAQLLGYEVVARIAHALEETLGGGVPGTPAPAALPSALPSAEVLLATLDALRTAAADSAAVDVSAALERLLGAGPPPAAGERRRSRPLRPPRAGGSPAAPAPTSVSHPIERLAGETGTAPFGGARRVGSRPGSRHRTVRVATERVDQLLARTGELIVARNRARRRWLDVRSAADELPAWAKELSPGTAREHALRLARAIADGDQYEHELQVLLERLEQDLLGLRIVPMELLFRPFARMVRDLARSTAKEVHFEEVGWETPLDRELLEQLREPVMHLLRNAIDHGIETPAQRAAAGKPPSGRVALRAAPRAGGVVIEVWDDGRGLDAEAIGATARRLGLHVPEEAPLDVIFQPGFSTAPQLTAVSGRGLGLDAVRSAVAAIGGSAEVASQHGRETSFTLRVPLTLVQTKMLLLRAGGQRYAVPVAAVQRVNAIRLEHLGSLGPRHTAIVDDEQVVVSTLTALLGTSSAASDSTAGFLIVMDSTAGRTGVLVDSVEGEREIVVRGLGPLLSDHPLLAGGALVDDQAVVPVLDPAALVRRALERSAVGSPARALAKRPIRVLVVEDSLTTRTLERNVLAAAGFEVDLAVDGRDALRQIRARRPDVVVSDIDMPRMDGFELLRTIRADADIESLPVVLVTSLEQPDQRELGFELGADAYLPKSTFDERALVEQIQELVP